MDLGVIVFGVTEASLSLETHAHAGDQACLALELVVRAPAEIVDADGSALAAARWTLLLFDEASSNRLDVPKGALGTAVHRDTADGPAAVLRVQMRALPFARLLAALMEGKPPQAVEAGIQGLRDTPAGLRWDHRGAPELPVLTLGIDTPLVPRRG